MDEAADIDAYFAEVERLCEADPRLSPLGAGILAGISHGVADDSRSFAKHLGIEHALVLREVQELSDLGLIEIARRDPRTQRCYYRLAV